MKTLSRLLVGGLFGALIALGAPVVPVEAAETCDTLTCTEQGCCTINSQTGEICDCEPWI